ncbi:TIR-like protein FxsC [Rhizocola hellebori]|uniref:TIR-like protein FxsC n=1 Tax=Rhizocola hellebori TaxID=1392758 RepID=UPI001942A033|nr:TIR-like protein FxsC [Rhizocola hellebori]
MSDEKLEESGAPVFFVSYARSKPANSPVLPPHETNAHVQRLFRDLTQHVNQLVPLSAGCDPGFMDMTMTGGALWERELRTNAGSCQVLICLLSPPYLRSEWCAMEWDIFSAREVVRRSDGKPASETMIVPVLWVPILEELPKMIDEVTLFSPRDLHDSNISPMYEREGLYGILNTDPGAYPALVWKLAKHIQVLQAKYEVLPKVPDSIDGLNRHFFKEPG